MKKHTTNYQDTFIEIAEDCPVNHGEIPPVKEDKKTIANYQFDMLIDHPYEYTSDEVLFAVYAIRKDIEPVEWEAEKQGFFSKGQPCLRTSPLAKRYGWGIHSDGNGRIALYGADSDEYRKYIRDDSLKRVQAMRNKRK